MGERVELRATPLRMSEKGGAWVLRVPRLGNVGGHQHTLGLLTPYFRGLKEGRLLGTRCVDPKCPVRDGKGELWIPPRADCPDCHRPMLWDEVKEPRGAVYTYTYVEQGGTGLEIECPYYQIDVRIQGVCTIVKSYLIDRKPIKIGDAVRARFRTGVRATHTCLDLYWELV
ncbi:MAG: hypothetical protein ABII00_01505 [Elusimicrobiota bacterium]